MMNYPLDLKFKIATIGTRVSVTDAGGRMVAYVRKKKFRLKEDIGVYADEDQKKLLFRIKADRAMDFGASYSVALPDGTPLGAVRQEGMRSLWKSTYVLTNASGSGIGSIHEENPWVKVLDGLMEAIPFGDSLGGLFFNPAYIVELRGTHALRVAKQRSVFESSFRLEKLEDFSELEEDLILAGVIMMVLMERDRG